LNYLKSKHANHETVSNDGKKKLKRKYGEALCNEDVRAEYAASLNKKAVKAAAKVSKVTTTISKTATTTTSSTTVNRHCYRCDLIYKPDARRKPWVCCNLCDNWSCGNCAPKNCNQEFNCEKCLNGSFSDELSDSSNDSSSAKPSNSTTMGKNCYKCNQAYATDNRKKPWMACEDCNNWSCGSCVPRVFSYINEFFCDKCSKG
jgi:hypothetical protein